MKKIKIILIEVIVLVFILALSGCGNQKIGYNWGETPRSVIKRLNKNRVRYYFDEGDKKATIIVDSKDLEDESNFEESVFYFTKERYIGEERKNYGEGRLVLIGNSMSGEEFSVEKAQEEIEKITKEFGEPTKDTEENDLDGFTWNKGDTEITTRYFEEEGIFRLTMKMSDKEAEGMKEGQTEEFKEVEKKDLEYNWDEGLNDTIERFQKNNIVYYLKGNEKLNVVTVCVDGKSLDTSKHNKIYYYKKSEGDIDGKLFVVGENVHISQSELESRLKEIDKEEGEEHTLNEELESSISYTWKGKDGVLEGMYDKKNGVLYLAKKRSDT